MSSNKTTSTTNTTVTPTKEETELNKLLLERQRELNPQMTEVQGQQLDLASILLSGGTLPGNLSGLTGTTQVGLGGDSSSQTGGVQQSVYGWALSLQGGDGKATGVGNAGGGGGGSYLGAGTNGGNSGGSGANGAANTGVGAGGSGTGGKGGAGGSGKIVITY